MPAISRRSGDGFEMRRVLRGWGCRPARRWLSTLSLVPAVAFGAPAQAEPDRYVDSKWGFVFEKPALPMEGDPNGATVVVTLSGTPSDGFAPNVNVLVQHTAQTLAAYRDQQRREMSFAGWELLEQTLSEDGGEPFLRTHARGAFGGQAVEILAITRRRSDGKLFVLTCTASPDQFPGFRASFERTLASFELTRIAYEETLLEE